MRNSRVHFALLVKVSGRAACVSMFSYSAQAPRRSTLLGDARKETDSTSASLRIPCSSHEDGMIADESDVKANGPAVTDRSAEGDRDTNQDFADWDKNKNIAERRADCALDRQYTYAALAHVRLAPYDH